MSKSKLHNKNYRRVGNLTESYKTENKICHNWELALYNHVVDNWALKDENRWYPDGKVCSYKLCHYLHSKLIYFMAWRKKTWDEIHLSSLDSLELLLSKLEFINKTHKEDHMNDILFILSYFIINFNSNMVICVVEFCLMF